MNRLRKFAILTTVLLLSSSCTALMTAPKQTEPGTAKTESTASQTVATSPQPDAVERSATVERQANEPQATPDALDSKYVEISQRVQAQVPQQKLYQTSKDLDELYQAAAVADVELQKIAQELAQLTQGTVVLPPEGLKGRERTQEKIMVEYDGDASRITDLTRLALEYDSLDEIYNSLETVVNRTQAVRMKDRFIDPTPGGYRDILLNVKLSNGHIGEIQLTLSQINEARFSQGHKLYEEVRGIQAKAMMGNRSLTPEESQRIETLNQASEKLYGEALRKAQQNQ
ncbi:MAG: hypothetical protein ACRC8A_09410 [Microcoleaceae cyanobacterium]